MGRPIDPADRLIRPAGAVAQFDLSFPPRKTLLEGGSRSYGRCW